jgi:hypothetical protein
MVSDQRELVVALTGDAARPKAFPLLKIARQCCSGVRSSEVDRHRKRADGAQNRRLLDPNAAKR